MRFAFAVPLVLAILLLEVALGKSSHTVTELSEAHLAIFVFVNCPQGFTDIMWVYFILKGGREGGVIVTYRKYIVKLGKEKSEKANM